MTMTIEIAPEMETLLSIEAQRRGLSPHKFVQVVLEEKLARQKVSREVLLEMLAEGMISHIPEGVSDEADEFEPLGFSGKPVSETILEERR